MSLTVNAFRAYLASSLQNAGSETTIYIDRITTLTGETIATSDFATFGRGTITLDPLSATAIEFASFTGVDSAALSLTGAIRGLSAKSNTSSTARMPYHAVSTPVIISFGVHNLEDLKTYIDGLIAGTIGNASNSVAGVTKITEDLGSRPRANAALVSQQTSPNMTLKVNPFSVAINEFSIKYAGGNTATLVAPVTNPRIDLVVYDTTGSAIAVRAGTEAASPTEPTATAGDIILCSIYHRVGETTLLEQDTTPNTQGYIKRWYLPGVYNTYLKSNIITVPEGDQGQTTQDSSAIVGEANATTKHNKIAQSFVPTHALIKGVKLWKVADSGSFTGTVTIALQADSSGSPSGSNLASTTITNATWLLLPAAAAYVFNFSAEYSMTVGSTYWLVISTSTSDNTNHPNFGANSAGGYTSGSVKYNNTTDGWLAYSTIDLYFKTMEGTLGQVPQTDSTTGLFDQSVLPYSFVDMDSTAVTLLNSTTATTVYTKTLAGGFFKATTGLRIMGKCSVVYETNGGPSVSVTAYINGVSIGSVTVTPGAPGGNNSGITYGGFFEITVINTTISAQKYVARSMLVSNLVDSGTTGGLAGFSSSGSGTSAVDTSGPCVLTLVFQNSPATASRGFTYTNLTLEKIG